MYTVREAAKELGISNPRIYQLIRQGSLKAEKFGNAWMIDEKSVQERLNLPHNSGRPPKSYKKDLRRYTLMNREYEVLDFDYDVVKKRFAWSGEVKDKNRAPIGIATPRAKFTSASDLQNWWNHRVIPAERPGISEKLESLGYERTADITFDTLGFSLSDQYWIKPEGVGLDWHDLNFFENDFGAGYGDVDMLSGVGLKNPDNTSDGDLPKKWICDAEDRVLLKGSGSLGQEPFNEVIATNLFSRYLKRNEYIDYTTREFGNQIVSECSCFLNSYEEYVPAWHIVEAKKKPNNINYYHHYINSCIELGVEDIERHLEQMIVLDFIMMNHDRHYRNFGLIRNVEDLTWRVAPLFDTGNSLLSDVAMFDLKNGYFRYTSKPFYKDPKRQLRLASDFSWINIDMLDGFTNYIEEVFSVDETLSQRAPYIVQAVNKQIEIIKFLI